MDVVKVWSGLTFGDRFVPVEIQITYGAGLPAFHMVGMVSESVERIKRACPLRIEVCWKIHTTRKSYGCFFAQRSNKKWCTL